MVDIIAKRVMESIDIHGIHAHDPNLADFLILTYASHASHTQALIPCLCNWWGSREQVVFLQVLAALLSSTTKDVMPLKEEYACTPSIMIKLSASVEDSVVKALLYCPGPWDEKSYDMILSHRHDDMSLVAACVIVGARWCRKNKSRISDLSERVHACISGRLCTRRWDRMFISTSVQEVRKELVQSD